MENPNVSIIIPTLGREDALAVCLDSIHKQTYKNYEIILVRERGELPYLRNQGAKRATGQILAFIDDDVYCPPPWLQAAVQIFHERKEVVGVSGPAVIRDQYRKNRDLFKYRWLKLLYDRLFLEGKAHLPGHISRAGAWTTGATEETCSYEGEVSFLEACNQFWRKEAFENVGGFDEAYKGVGDWSEPDLCLRVCMRYDAEQDLWIGSGRTLHFSPSVRLEHRPSRAGAYRHRAARTSSRWVNYQLFSKRWIRPSWRHSAYKATVRSYLWLKERNLL